jgi:hypothetical protein
MFRTACPILYTLRKFMKMGFSVGGLKRERKKLSYTCAIRSLGVEPQAASTPKFLGFYKERRHHNRVPFLAYAFNKLAVCASGDNKKKTK